MALKFKFTFSRLRAFKSLYRGSIMFGPVLENKFALSFPILVFGLNTSRFSVDFRLISVLLELLVLFFRKKLKLLG